MDCPRLTRPCFITTTLSTITHCSKHTQQKQSYDSLAVAARVSLSSLSGSGIFHLHHFKLILYFLNHLYLQFCVPYKRQRQKLHSFRGSTPHQNILKLEHSFQTKRKTKRLICNKPLSLSFLTLSYKQYSLLTTHPLLLQQKSVGGPIQGAFLLVLYQPSRVAATTLQFRLEIRLLFRKCVFIMSNWSGLLFKRILALCLFCSQVCSSEVNMRNVSCSEGYPCSSEV